MGYNKYVLQLNYHEHNHDFINDEDLIIHHLKI